MNLDQLRLMHEVLDGEASVDEARELDRLLATDPEARAEYEALRSLFKGLNAMPKAVLPEGMVAETIARISSRLPRRHRLRQLSSRWRVFVSDSRRLREKSSTRDARTQRHFQGEHNYRNADMNRSKLWIGVGVAAVAVIAGAYYFNFPPSSDMSGTIAPANRSVAAQPGAADMTPISQGDATPSAVNVADAASRDAGRDSAKDSLRDAGKDSAKDSLRDAGKDSAKDSLRDAGKDSAKDSLRDAGKDSAKDSLRDAGKDSAKDSFRDAGKDSAKDSLRDAGKDAVHDASSQQ